MYPGPSIYDLFALVLALDRECPLLTGDKQLRELATSKDVDVFGTLWLMERMFNSRLMSLDEMALAYDRVLDTQRRLPPAEIEAQLRRLGQ